MLGAENSDTSLAAKEHGALFVGGQAADFSGPALAHIGVGCDLVVIGDVHREEALVKGNGLDVYVGPQQFGTSGLDAAGGLQHGLGCARHAHAQVLQALLIPAAVVNLPGVDADGLFWGRVAAKRAG